MAQPSITCPICGMTSYHPEDIRNSYCGNCHWWTSDPDLVEFMPAPGADWNYDQALIAGLRGKSSPRLQAVIDRVVAHRR